MDRLHETGPKTLGGFQSALHNVRAGIIRTARNESRKDTVSLEFHL